MKRTLRSAGFLLALLLAAGCGVQGSSSDRSAALATNAPASSSVPSALPTFSDDEPATTSPGMTLTPAQFPALQLDNPHAAVALEPGGLTELAPNYIGDTFPLDRHSPPCPRAEGDWSFTHVEELGLTWVRLSLDRIELETARRNDDYSSFEVNPCQEEIIDLLAAHNVTILYTLVYWDPQDHADRHPDYGNPEEVDRYLAYAQFLADHFEGRIQYYEVLNEAVTFEELADYLSLVRQVAPLLRSEDPGARVVAGGASNPLYEDSASFLTGLTGSEVMPLVDGINLHPMYGSSPAYAELREYYYTYPDFVRRLQRRAEERGFRGEYFAEEMVWRMTFNTTPDELWTYSRREAAKYYARGIVINRGLGLYAGLGGEAYDTVPAVAGAIRNLGTVLAGARPTEGPSVELEGESDRIASYWFADEEGNLLLALWDDGVAVDHHPGVPTTVALPGLRASSVTGIDILYGARHPLVTADESGTLTVRGLLLKDFPLVLRFRGVSTTP